LNECKNQLTSNFNEWRSHLQSQISDILEKIDNGTYYLDVHGDAWCILSQNNNNKSSKSLVYSIVNTTLGLRKDYSVDVEAFVKNLAKIENPEDITARGFFCFLSSSDLKKVHSDKPSVRKRAKDEPTFPQSKKVKRIIEDDVVDDSNDGREMVVSKSDSLTETTAISHRDPLATFRNEMVQEIATVVRSENKIRFMMKTLHDYMVNKQEGHVEVMELFVQICEL